MSEIEILNAQHKRGTHEASIVALQPGNVKFKRYDALIIIYITQRYGRSVFGRSPKRALGEHDYAWKNNLHPFQISFGVKFDFY